MVYLATEPPKCSPDALKEDESKKENVEEKGTFDDNFILDFVSFLLKQFKYRRSSGILMLNSHGILSYRIANGSRSRNKVVLLAEGFYGQVET